LYIDYTSIKLFLESRVTKREIISGKPVEEGEQKEKVMGGVCK
jgi:hypothetical protein